MKTITFAVLMCTIATSTAFATAQYPDILIYEGKEYDLLTNPMEPYFDKYPQWKPRSGAMSTALWRGYVATFEFRENRLFLKDIVVLKESREQDQSKWKSAIDWVLWDDKELMIDWFTGILVLPVGKMKNYVHMGYGSTYSNYILLELKSGMLVGKRTYNHKQYKEFKRKQFQAYKKTEDYKKRSAQMKKDGTSQDLIDSFLQNYIIKYTSELLDKEKPSNKPTTERDN